MVVASEGAVVPSAAKDLALAHRGQILRFAQDDGKTLQREGREGAKVARCIVALGDLRSFATFALKMLTFPCAPSVPLNRDARSLVGRIAASSG